MSNLFKSIVESYSLFSFNVHNRIDTNFQIKGYEPKYKQSEKWLNKNNSIDKINQIRIKNGEKPLNSEVKK